MLRRRGDYSREGTRIQPGRISASFLALLFIAGLLASINLSPGHASALSGGALDSWTATTSLPTANGYATSVVANGYVYEIGGGNSSSIFATVDYAAINSNGTLGPWTATTSLPVGSAGATSVVANGYVYEIGGSDGSSSYVATVDYAAINSNGTPGPWTATTSLPTATDLATSVVANGYVYEIGGYNGSSYVATVDYAAISPAQLTSRAMTTSSSVPGVSGVTYHVSVDSATAGSMQTIVVDFCSNSPVIGASCTAPTGFSVGSTPTVTNVLLGGTADGGTWTALTPDSGRTLVFTRGSPVPVTSGESISFNIDNVTNPSTTGTFYGRILLYPFTQTGYSATSPGAYTQFGGVALSTASPIDISATVQEAISFCVYTTTCGGPVDVTLGHTVGGTTVIDSSTVDTQPVNFSLSTNASSGASVSIFGATLTDGSGQTIPAMTTAGAITAGTADFGLYVSTLGSGMSVASPYNTSASNYYYGASSSTATEIASCSSPINNAVSTITYGVTASNTTPAGTYTATHQLIATGTF